MWRIEPVRFRGSTAGRLSIAARIAAAVFGGYALAHTLSIALAAALPVATLFAIQGSFLAYVAAVLWAFAARSALAAWLGLLLPAGLAGLAAWGLA
ncbi:MAG: DUF3649 domain-containing protein [Sulfuritalea sp.]|nr:DUF3649 domain-containing protein [Sulfuritalea sp.]